jgi:uncharacterized Zn finger protein
MVCYVCVLGIALPMIVSLLGMLQWQLLIRHYIECIVLWCEECGASEGGFRPPFIRLNRNQGEIDSTPRNTVRCEECGAFKPGCGMITLCWLPADRLTEESALAESTQRLLALCKV